uniref:Uncharacterized protein n=1 Tax=Opuntia streptacantha TaxID=393608 RepID=A0A7C9AFD6_OPUST
MAAFGRLLPRRAKILHTSFAASSSKTLYPQPRFCHGFASQRQALNAFKDPIPVSTPKSTWFPHMVVLAGFLGGYVLDKAYADAGEVSAKSPLPSELPAAESPLPSESHTSYEDLEETAKKERRRLEDLLKSKGMQYGSYPKFTVAVKGQKVNSLVHNILH